MVFEATRQFYKIFDSDDRRRFQYILAGSSVGGLLDLVGLAAVAPFVAVAVRPELVTERGWLSVAYEQLPWGSPKNFVTALGLVSFLLMSATLLFRVFLYRSTLKFAEALKRKLTVRLTRLYLAQPYQYFLGVHSNDLKKQCSQEVNQVVQGFLLPFASAVSKLSGSLILILALLWLEPLVALLFLFLFSFAVLFLYGRLSHVWEKEGEEHLHSGRGAERLLEQAFCGLRELKLAGREQFVVRHLEKLTNSHQAAMTNFQLASEIRVSALRFLGLGGLIATTLILINSREDVAGFVPVLGVLLLAIYRLLPSLQAMLNALSRIRFSVPVLESMNEALSLPYTDCPENSDCGELPFTESLEVANLSFRYPAQDKIVLDQVSLSVACGSKVGIVGRSGSGKTTLLDLIAGLLPADPWALRVDGVELEPGKIRAWRDSIGYVPQKSFLLDDTVKANIALGLEADEVDIEKVEEVSRRADIHEFIMTLPNGYDSQVGQNGTWLSGGQKQRISIARALYRSPKLLILDEATNALDIFTEKRVLESISDLQPALTIIIVTHRLDPLKDCDTIHVLNGEGRLKASGTFDELMKSSWLFRKLAGS